MAMTTSNSISVNPPTRFRSIAIVVFISRPLLVLGLALAGGEVVPPAGAEEVRVRLGLLDDHADAGTVHPNPERE